MQYGRATKLCALALLGTLAIAPGAQAQDAVPVTLPWSGGFLRVTSAQRTFDATVNHLFDNGALLGVTLSGPLDSESREAAFTRAGRLASGFTAHVTIGYDSRANWLASREPYTATAFQHQLELLNACPGADHAGIQAVLNEIGARSTPNLVASLEELTTHVHSDDLVAADRAAVCHRLAELGGDPPAINLGSLRSAGAVSMRRELNRTGLLNRGATTRAWFLGADLRGSYDRLSVYGSNLGVAATGQDQYSVSGGAAFRLTWPSMMLSLAAGGTYERAVNTRTVERCVSEMSMDPMVTARSCDAKALVLDGTPEAVGSFYARAGFVYVFGSSGSGEIVPGLEVQASLTSGGRDNVVGGRFLGFLSPTTGPAITRFGVGLDVSRDLGGSNPSTTVTPFVLVGASLRPG